MNEREQFEAWLYTHRNEQWSAAVLAFEAFKAGAALSAPPAGYVLVPREPTPAMERAAFDVLPIDPGHDGYPNGTAARNAVYKAMLAAAPQPAEPKEGEQHG